MSYQEVDGYAIAIVQGTRSLVGQFRSEWTELCNEGPCRWLTYRPEWTTAFLASYGPDSAVHFVVVRREGQLRGLLPMMDGGVGVGRARLKRLTLTGNFHAWELDLVHGLGDKDYVVQATSRFLARWRGWDMLTVHSAPESGAFADVYAAATGKKSTRSMNSWFIDCPPAGTSMIDTIGISCLTRQRQMKRHLKKLDTLGNPTWHRVSAEDGIDTVLACIESFFELEARGWKGHSETVVLEDERLRRYYRELGTAGFIVIHTLSLDDRLIASNIGVLDGERFFSLRIAFDEEFSAVSPGHLMTLYTVKDAADHGCTMLDLGGTNHDEATYKTTWTDKSYPVATYTIYPDTVRGRAVEKLWENLIPSIQQKLGRVRRLSGRKNRSDAVATDGDDSTSRPI